MLLGNGEPVVQQFSEIEPTRQREQSKDALRETNFVGPPPEHVLRG